MAKKIKSHNSSKINILHIITDLDIGGSEIMLIKLLYHLKKDRFKNFVVSLKSNNPLKKFLKDKNILIYELNLDYSRNKFNKVLNLLKIIKNYKPDIIHTLLYHADLIGIIIGKFILNKKVIWNIRCSNMNLKKYGKSGYLVFKLCSNLSNFPNSIIFNSEIGKYYHINKGYCPKESYIIPNGFDLSVFKPDNIKRELFRAKYNINKNCICIGIASRYDMMKDHDNFLMAASLIKNKLKNIKFLMCGNNVDPDNKDLISKINYYDLHKNVILLGKLSNIIPFYQSLDIYCSSSSFGEGFPNAVGEAMACGVPCVVTDVGDCKKIVKGVGLVVPPKNSNELSKAMLKLINMSKQERKSLGLKAREKIKKNYDIKNIVKQYENLFIKIARI